MHWSIYAGAGSAAFIILVFTHWLAMQYGGRQRKRMLSRVFKKRSNRATRLDFIMQPAEDGTMEILISRKQYRALKIGPLEGAVIGKKNRMLFRLGIQ